jgi:hypothetical protein
MDDAMQLIRIILNNESKIKASKLEQLPMTYLLGKILEPSNNCS